MLEFLDAQLSDTTADWKIVSGHHPCYLATGNYETIRPIRDNVRPIMQKHSTDVYLAGHEHNQQHWQVVGYAEGIDNIITGAGGKKLSPYIEDAYEKSLEDGGQLMKLDMDYGFTYMNINSEAISWKFVNSDLEVTYEHTRIKK